MISECQLEEQIFPKKYFTDCRHVNDSELTPNASYALASQIKCSCTKCTDFIEIFTCSPSNDNINWWEEKLNNCCESFTLNYFIHFEMDTKNRFM